MEPVLLAILLLFSAFFSGSETALFSLRREALRDFAASPSFLKRRVAILLSRPRTLLITILFGNLLVNIFFYSVASSLAWSRSLEGRGLEAAILAVAAPLIVILFGEVTPKALGLANPEMIAQVAAFPLVICEVVFTPVRLVVEATSRFVTNMLIRPSHRQPYVTSGELKMLVDLSRRQGALDDQMGVMMQQIVDFAEIKVREVMVPRVDLALFDVGAPTADFLQLAQRVRHARLPVYEATLDNVVGIVYVKEALLHPEKPLREMVRPVFFVPESKTIESLLAEFRSRRESLAMVVDEYGGIAGLVTLEDVTEEIVGEIRDEYDQATPDVVELDDTTYQLSGRLGVRAWTDLFDVDPEDLPSDTLGGFVAWRLGHLPSVGESIRYANLSFTVESIQRHRIERVRVQIISPVVPETAT